MNVGEWTKVKKIWESWEATPIWIVLGSLGYFVYGGASGFLATLLYSFFLSLTVLLALIPLIGVLLQLLVAWKVAEPFVFSLTGIWATNLTAVLFAFAFIAGVILNLAILGVVKSGS